MDEEKGVPDADSAIAGALDIIAEEISDNAEYRKKLRAVTFDYGFIESKKIKDGPVFEQYYEYSEKISKIPPHRVLALNRGEEIPANADTGYVTVNADNVNELYPD